MTDLVLLLCQTIGAMAASVSLVTIWVLIIWHLAWHSRRGDFEEGENERTAGEPGRSGNGD